MWESSTAVIVDANILVLLIIGAVEPTKIGIVPKTKKYTSDDYEKALGIVSGFRWVVTTPHVLSQATDLVRHAGLWGDLAQRLTAALRDIYSGNEERFVPARKLAKLAAFSEIGLADCSTIEAAKHGCTLFSDDLPLHNVALSLGCSSINFSEVRFDD